MAILWQSNYSGDGFSRFSKVQRAAPDRVTIVKDPDGSGRDVVRCEVRKGDKPPDTSGDRAEMVRSFPAINEVEGQERFYRWRTFFAPDFPYLNPKTQGGQLFIQWHQQSDSGAPPLEMVVRGEEIHLGGYTVGGAHRIVWRGKLVRGCWLDFVLHVGWSATSGFVRLLVDGAEVLPRTAFATLFPGQHNYLKMGLYRKAGLESVSVLYHGDVTMGETLEDVMPPSAEELQRELARVRLEAEGLRSRVAQQQATLDAVRKALGAS